MNGAFIAVMAIIVIILLTVTQNKNKERTIENGTEITVGYITDVKWTAGDRPKECYYYWKISYSVDGRQYTLESEDPRMRKQDMETHVGEKVEVHYEPGNAANAYAIVHGVKAWHGTTLF